MKPPIWGAGSVLLPLVMAGLWLIFERSSYLGKIANGYLALFALAFFYVWTVMVIGSGIALGVGALVRRERGLVLGILGIIANIVLASWIFR